MVTGVGYSHRMTSLPVTSVTSGGHFRLQSELYREEN